MPRKLKGGKIIHCGSYGCVFKPALHCSGASLTGNEVTKVISAYDRVKEELESDMDPSKIQALTTNDPTRSFVLYGEPLNCKLSVPSEEQLEDIYNATFNETEFYNSKGTKIKSNGNYSRNFPQITNFDQFKNYVLKHGLKDFGYYNMIEAKPYPENYKFQKHDCDMLMNCIRFIHSVGFAHCDLHNENFLHVKKDKFFAPLLIDLGQSRWFEGQFVLAQDKTVVQLAKVSDDLSYKNLYLTYKDYLYFYYDIKQFHFNYKQHNYFPLVPLAKFRVVVQFLNRKPLFLDSLLQNENIISHAFEGFGIVMKNMRAFQNFFTYGIDDVLANFSKYMEPLYTEEKYNRGDMSREEKNLFRLLDLYKYDEENDLYVNERKTGLYELYPAKQFYVEYFADFPGFYDAPKFRGYILFRLGFYKFFFEEELSDENARTQAIILPTLEKHNIIRKEDETLYDEIFNEAIKRIRIYRLVGQNNEVILETMNPNELVNFVVSRETGFYLNKFQCIKVDGKAFVISHQVYLSFDKVQKDFGKFFQIVYHNDRNNKVDFEDDFFKYKYVSQAVTNESLDQNYFYKLVYGLIGRQLTDEERARKNLMLLDSKQKSRPGAMSSSEQAEYARFF